MYFVLFCILVAGPGQGRAQKQINLGAGYFGAGRSAPGLVLALELEPFQSESFSSPTRLNLGYFKDPDYGVAFLDLHKGFRKYFRSGLYLEQSVGIGLMATYYDVENLYYFDRYRNSIRFKEGANISVMPSVDLGIGYLLGDTQTSQNRIWIRPRIYWNLGFRNLAFPYAAIQAGFSHTLNAR